MRHPVETESPDQPDAQALALQEALHILLPIRRQRLRRSEQKQREQQQLLSQQNQSLVQGEQLALGQQQAWQQSQADFVEHHTGVLQPLNVLQLGIEQEQSCRLALVQQQLHNQQLVQQIEQQQENVHSARQDVQRCQREVEKLEYLLEQQGRMS